jgi:hypothetical protein
MFVPFDTLPPSARIWIYQSDKVFSSSQREILLEELLAFTEAWTAHGNPMKASFQLPYDHFIILAADERYTEASGCSIDSSVHTLRVVSEKTGLTFLDRTRVAFKKNDAIEVISINDLKKGFSAGKWSGESLTFNNLLTTKAQLPDWLTPARVTWLKRYLSPESVAN